ncbi:MAG TPA: bifunctional DNA primase/polymerase, partial [Thermodesulfovibrio thiophilus]|nr:bifunctional DNA primase/polymerase [Thermodesulfovibrio thiophilus]
MENKRFDYAKFYVETLNFSVIPISTNNKKPVIEWKEYQNRKPTIEKLKEWFIKNNYNVGIITGKISNIVVVDLDSDEA